MGGNWWKTIIFWPKQIIKTQQLPRNCDTRVLPPTVLGNNISSDIDLTKLSTFDTMCYDYCGTAGSTSYATVVL